MFSFIEGKHVNYSELKIDGSSPSPGALELVVDIFDNCQKWRLTEIFSYPVE